jgi:glutamate dehydrogenase (NAD(P)+)
MATKSLPAKGIKALSRISEAITSDLYLEDILRLIVTVTAQVMNSKICSLWLIDEKDKEFKLRATQTISKEYLKERSLKLGEGVVGFVARQRKPAAILDVLKEPRYKEKELAKKEGLCSMLSVPMEVKGKVLGVINCYTSSPHKFSKTEIDVLITVANQAAIAIENTELMVKTKVIQEELESRKLVEKAKGVLMKDRKISEEDAFRIIQRQSMNSRKSMREVAEAIILMQEIEGIEKPEKQMSIRLRVKIDEKNIISTDAYLVYYNTARGPAKGGIRFASNVTLAETEDLAERMVWKTALVRIPFGGGKAGVRIDPEELDSFSKGIIMRRFATEIQEELLSGKYIPAPDMGTGPREMAIIYGVTGMLECVTGKPPRIGGLPGRRESTGYGVTSITAYALKNLMKKRIEGAKIAIQGYGNVGGWVSRFLQKRGAKIVGVTDIHGGVFEKDGLDTKKLQDYYQEKGTVKGFNKSPITNEDLFGLDVDVFIPAACENMITKETAEAIRAKLIIEGANGPTTHQADKVLQDKGIVVIPDILANSGGVIASYVEWRSAKSGSITQAEEVYQMIEEIITTVFKEIIEVAAKNRITYRDAASVIAVREVVGAMHDRGQI